VLFKAHLFFIAILLCSCSASLPYATNYPLTNKIFHSRDGIFSGKIPEGWFSSTEDSLASGLVVWLIKDDLSATLSIKELKLDRLTSQQVMKEGLKVLVRPSFLLHDDNITGDGPEVKEFTIAGRKFCSYEQTSQGKRERIVIFAAKEKCYECETAVITSSSSQKEMAQVFTAQQTTLSSLSF
jgi:hypothetical protein